MESTTSCPLFSRLIAARGIESDPEDKMHEDEYITMPVPGPIPSPEDTSTSDKMEDISTPLERSPSPHSMSPEPQAYSKDIPEMNTYELKKADFEMECCKIRSPFMYLYHPRIKSKQDQTQTCSFEEPDQLTAAKLKDLFQNEYYFEKDDKGKWVKHKFILRWMDDPHIKEYTGIVVDPLNSNPEYYNMWKPYKASLLPPVPPESVMELLEMFINHINVVYTNHNIDHTNFILDYMCNIIQRPTQKTNVALHFKGLEGAGKGILWEFLRKSVLGLHCTAQTSNPEHDIFGRFANTCVNRVFVQIDEAMSKIRVQDERLKDIITNETINYEKKGKDTITLKNLTNFIFTTNNQFVHNITANDRRFVLFECSSIYKNDIEYLSKMGAYLKRPEVARAFYQFAMDRDLSKYKYDFQPFRPKTDFYRETQKLSIPPVARFLSALVNHDISDLPADSPGKIFSVKNGYLEISPKIFYKKFIDYLVSGNNKVSYSDAWFYTTIKQYQGITKERTSAYRFYRINMDVLKNYLVKSNEYDDDACMD